MQISGAGSPYPLTDSALDLRIAGIRALFCAEPRCASHLREGAMNPTRLISTACWDWVCQHSFMGLL
jgi:hypothetical protein